MPSQPPVDEILIRQARPEDAAVCGQICFDAFQTINQAHGFPCDFPNSEVTTRKLAMIFSHPGYYAAVAEVNGRIVGSNCLDERSSIAGAGPLSIDPHLQNRGVGRMLMHAVMTRASERGAAGVRLVQAVFHNRSLGLHISLGFETREPISCVQGQTLQRNVPGCTVRPARAADLRACNALAQQVHGFHRGRELVENIAGGSALVVEREQRITGYASSLGFFGHATAETNLDMQALIASAESFAGPGILLPARNTALIHWCLANGLRIVQPMTLMSLGMYNEPAGAWLPSVQF